jgi:nitrogen fixation protein FixH
MVGRILWDQRHWLLIIGLFVMFFVANGIMVFFSLTSWNGVVEEHHYEKGLAFNQRLEAQRRQDALGWRDKLEQPRWTKGKAGRLTWTLTQADGLPVTDAQVMVRLVRPVTEGWDQAVVLREESPGFYVGEITPMLSGMWTLHLKAARKGADYRTIQRITVTAPSAKE